MIKLYALAATNVARKRKAAVDAPNNDDGNVQPLDMKFLLFMYDGFRVRTGSFSF